MGKCICYQLLLGYSVDLRHPATGISFLTMVSKILKAIRVVKKKGRGTIARFMWCQKNSFSNCVILWEYCAAAGILEPSY